MSMTNPVKGVDSSTVTDINSIENKSSGLDKDTFLQLLVAQMKYQDPLEPASSTEYISQLAQFTSLEEMENLNQSFDQSDAQSLVGSYVIMKTIGTDGKEDYISGLVDYVTMNNGKPYLSINDGFYDYNDLDSVVDIDYMTALAAKQDKEASGNNTESGDSNDK